jgi:hypothetical protein
MTLQEYLRLAQIPTDPYTEMGMLNILDMSIKDGRATVELNETALQLVSDHAASILLKAARLPFIMRLEIYLQTQVFGKGPKVFLTNELSITALGRNVPEH